MKNIEIKTVKVETATPEALAPFGVVLGRNENVKPLPINLYNGTVQVRRLGEFISDETTEIPSHLTPDLRHQFSQAIPDDAEWVVLRSEVRR